MKAIFYHIDHLMPVSWKEVSQFSSVEKTLLGAYLQESQHLPYYRELFAIPALWQDLKHNHVEDMALSVALKHQDFSFAWEIIQEDLAKSPSNKHDWFYKCLCNVLDIANPLFIWQNMTPTPKPSNTLHKTDFLFAPPFCVLSKDLPSSPIHGLIIKTMSTPFDAFLLGGRLGMDEEEKVVSIMKAFKAYELDNWLSVHPKQEYYFNLFFKDQLYPNLSFPKTWASVVREEIKRSLSQQDQGFEEDGGKKGSGRRKM